MHFTSSVSVKASHSQLPVEGAASFTAARSSAKRRQQYSKGVVDSVVYRCRGAACCHAARWVPLGREGTRVLYSVAWKDAASAGDAGAVRRVNRSSHPLHWLAPGDAKRPLGAAKTRAPCVAASAARATPAAGPCAHWPAGWQDGKQEHGEQSVAAKPRLNGRRHFNFGDPSAPAPHPPATAALCM
jgi:hypothetical protein